MYAVEFNRFNRVIFSRPLSLKTSAMHLPRNPKLRSMKA